MLMSPAFMKFMRITLLMVIPFLFAEGHVESREYGELRLAVTFVLDRPLRFDKSVENVGAGFPVLPTPRPIGM